MEKNIKISYDNSEELEGLIQDVYFKNNNGKINLANQKIEIDDNDILYSILKRLSRYEVKMVNNIVDGSMKFKVELDKDKVNLIPTSRYCIVKKEKYSFY